MDKIAQWIASVYSSYERTWTPMACDRQHKWIDGLIKKHCCFVALASKVDCVLEKLSNTFGSVK